MSVPIAHLAPSDLERIWSNTDVKPVRNLVAYKPSKALEPWIEKVTRAAELGAVVGGCACMRVSLVYVAFARTGIGRDVDDHYGTTVVMVGAST